jgi:hypothetical protein
VAGPIDRFVIERVLGRGGMAVVYLARDTVLDRQVALKVLQLGAMGDTAAKRFKREAKLIARLQHNHIVGIHDYLDGDDAAYIVMEYMAGGSLDRYVGLLTLSQVGGVLDAVLSALDRVSLLDPPIVHRDLKPHNLLVSKEGDTVKIADFGIARITGETLTSSGPGLGTFAYMAPEQWQRSGKVDARTDLYAVGVIAYQLLTGDVPFKGAEPLSVGLQHLHDRPVDPREHVPSLDAALAAWTLRLLAKEPGDRYQAPADARAELQAILERAVGPKWRAGTRITVPGARRDASTVPTGTADLDEPPAPAPRPRRARDPRPLAAGALALTAAAVAVAWSPWSSAGRGAAIGPHATATATLTATASPPLTLASGDHVRARLPPGWGQVPVPQIAGLRLSSSARAAAPAGDAGEGVAILGTAPRSAHRPGLLAAALAERLGVEPAPAELAGDVAALRYDGEQTVYAVPTSAGVVTVVCEQLAEARCDEVVRAVELVDAEAFPVGVDPSFRAGVNRALRGISSARRSLGEASWAEQQATAARHVADEFERARKRLARLRAVSPEDEPARAALVKGARDARAAYRRLAAAADAVDIARYASAGASANRAEKRLASALRALRKRGYRRLASAASGPLDGLRAPRPSATPALPTPDPGIRSTSPGTDAPFEDDN